MLIFLCQKQCHCIKTIEHTHKVVWKIEFMKWASWTWLVTLTHHNMLTTSYVDLKVLRLGSSPWTDSYASSIGGIYKVWLSWANSTKKPWRINPSLHWGWIHLCLHTYQFREVTWIIDKLMRRNWQQKLMISQLGIDLYMLPAALCCASVLWLTKWRLLIVTYVWFFIYYSVRKHA